MKRDRCSCGEKLVTRDEIVRSSCWNCSGLSWRLTMLDNELAALQAATKATRVRPMLLRAS